MTRPGAAEWSVLDLDSDPVPGDPDSFDEITSAYQDLARTTQEAHDLLASGSQIDVGQGKAMDAFRDLIGKLPGRLDTMAQSYGQAADAYLRYLPSLQEAQSMSLQALDQARQASGDQGAAAAALATAQAALTALTALGGDQNADQTAKDSAQDDVTAAQNRQQQAQQSLDQAKALLGQATALRDQAARTAARTLHQLAKNAPQRSLWEKIAEVLHDFVDFLESTVVQWITTVLDVLSTIASFIFPPLGEAIGLLSGAIDLGAALLTGDGGKIAMAAGGLALGLVPGGRLVGRIAKFAMEGGKALSGTVKGGIKAGTKELGGAKDIGAGAKSLDGGTAAAAGRGIDANAASLGPGKFIKGKLNAAGEKLNDLRNDAALQLGYLRRKFDKSTIIGQTEKGNITSFSSKDVKSEPLRDNNGKTVGVLFPSKSTDVASFGDFGKTHANLATGKNLGGTMDFSGLKIIRSLPGDEANFKNNNFLPAPWLKQKSDPNFVIAHGSPDSATVSLKNGKVVHVPGGEFAKVVNGNAIFKSATAANPKGSTALLSCNFGNTAGDAGAKFASVMQSLGHTRPIYAGTDVVQITTGTDLDGLITDAGQSITTVAVNNGGRFRRLTPNN